MPQQIRLKVDMPHVSLQPKYMEQKFSEPSTDMPSWVLTHCDV